MDFTREPIIETIITPKEGHKLAIRKSRQEDPEDYLVDAVEIVSFGAALFFRSLERPKAFLLPVADYEVLEVRETRMVLKTPSIDRSIKIGGGRDSTNNKQREHDKTEKEEERADSAATSDSKETVEEGQETSRPDKKRERRRQSRKRRGRGEAQKEGESETAVADSEEQVSAAPQDKTVEPESAPAAAPNVAHFSALLEPPPTLISETIERYRQNEAFKGAFYLSEDDHYKPHEKVSLVLNEEGPEQEVVAEAHKESSEEPQNAIEEIKVEQQEEPNSHSLPLFAEETNSFMHPESNEEEIR